MTKHPCLSVVSFVPRPHLAPTHRPSLTFKVCFS